MYQLLLSIPGDTVEVLDFQSKVSHLLATSLMYITSEAESSLRLCFDRGHLFAKQSTDSKDSNLYFALQPNASTSALSPALIYSCFNELA